MAAQVYLDNAATTPLDPRVAKAMRPWLGETFGNASSLHAMGRQARQAVDESRRQVAALLNVDPGEIVFTASGTEADNLALVGTVQASPGRPCHVVTSQIEHPAVLETCRYLERHGTEVTYLPCGEDGIVSPLALRNAMRPVTRLVSIMAANNVTGVVQPIAELARIARENGALFHTDAVQAAGKLPFDLRAQPFDLLSISAHKLHGPQGVGALYVRSGLKLEPLVHGGGQEQGLRSASEFVAGLVGLGRAAEIAGSEMSAEAVHLVALRDRLIETIATHIPGAYLIGHRHRRLPGHLCLGFAGQEGEAIKLLLALDELGFAVSSGSACSAPHASEPSYVMLAMGFDALKARGSLRVTLSRFNTAAEVDRFLEVLPPLVRSLRPVSTRAQAPHLSLNLGSPALLMMSADFRPGTTENSLEKEDRCAGWRPRIIESAGEPEFDAYFQVLAKGHRVMINQDEARGTRIRVDLPGLNCGFCGYRRCEEMAAHLDTNPDLLERCIHLAPERVSTQTAVVDHPRLNSACASCTTADRGNPAQTRTAWKDSLGREFDFYLEHFPEDPGPREIIIPHNPMLTREMDIQVGETLIGRPLGMSCGCPVTHCGVAVNVDRRTGVIVWCVTGPLRPRQEGFKDLGYYIAEGYEGMVTETRSELKIGMRYFFQPRMCMLQWRHSGLLNYLNRTPTGYQVRVEGLWIG